jgi:glutathione synthase/RimK-type ligase-like ATP-grasp enzyme
MKIAIHNNSGWNREWITYCQDRKIDHKVVDAYSSDIVGQVSDCDIFMWHHSHVCYKDLIFAKQLLYSLENRGMHVYPNFNTCWHFDDKVGQKYLLEAIKAPLVPSYVFYDKHTATQWADATSYPKVFKLRRGAASMNVHLVKNKKEAQRFIKRAFDGGFCPFDMQSHIRENVRKFKAAKISLSHLLLSSRRIIHKPEYAKMNGNEKGYVYFQDFIPNNSFDFRLELAGDKCWGCRRMVRPGDFRASGGGNEDHDHTKIPIDIVRQSFEYKDRLGMQSVGFDYLLNEGGDAVLLEMSYGFGYAKGDGEGYWTRSLDRIEEKIIPSHEIIQSMIKAYNAGTISRHAVEECVLQCV